MTRRVKETFAEGMARMLRDGKEQEDRAYRQLPNYEDAVRAGDARRMGIDGVEEVAPACRDANRDIINPAVNRPFNLQQTAAAFQTSPLGIVSACAEGRIQCWCFYYGELVALSAAQVTEAMKRNGGLIEMSRGSISRYLTGGKSVPTLNEILFREADVSRLPGFRYAPPDDVQAASRGHSHTAATEETKVDGASLRKKSSRASGTQPPRNYEVAHKVYLDAATAMWPKAPKSCICGQKVNARKYATWLLSELGRSKSWSPPDRVLSAKTLASLIAKNSKIFTTGNKK